MRKCQLKMYDPYIKTYVHHAYPLAMLEKTDEFYQWVQNKFTQVFYQCENPQDKFLNYTHYNFFEDDGVLIRAFHSVPFSSSEERKDLLEFVTELICDGWYIYGMWDEYFIPQSFTYQKRTYSHEFFLWGVDEKEETFDCAGYKRDYQWHYFQVGFREFLNAVLADKDRDPAGYLGFNAFRCNPDFRYAGDPDKCAEGIREYISHTDCTQNGENPKGIGAFDAFFQDVRDLGKKKRYIPRQSVYLAYEHKVLMLDRLQYLTELGRIELSDKDRAEYEKIRDSFHAVLNYWIKYAIRPSKKITTHMYDIAQKSLEEEADLLAKLI